MRTTLKRGIGRGAVLDGDGPPILPPDALGPVSRHLQPEPHRHPGLRLLAKVVLWGLAGLVMVAVGLVGGAYLFFHESYVALQARSADLRVAQKRLDVPLPGKPAIALIVGYDHRAGVESASAPSRSDTIMLLRADPQTKSISMLSFPRDLIVDVYCRPDERSFRGRINSAYATCGSKGTLETVRKLTGLPVNYLITVNFRGFRQIVDRLGGVWIDVDRRYFNDNAGRSPGYTYDDISLWPGYQRLDGARALDFVRYRHTDSDFFRVARQQQFVKSFKQQISSSFSLWDVPKVVGAITHNVEVGVGGGKPLSGKTVLSYARFAYGLPTGHFFQTRIEGISGYSELRTDSANLQQAVQDFVTPDVEAPQVATAVALGRRPKRPKPPPASEVTMTVLNGNGVPNSARDASSLLSQRGYRVVPPPEGKTANAPTFDYFHSKVYFDPAKGEPVRLAAKQVANLFGAADVEPIPPQIRPFGSGSVLTVVVGTTFHGSLAPPPVEQAPTRQPAAVVYDPAETRDLLRKAQRKAPFRLMVPQVIERNSSLDREWPIRVYPLSRRHLGVRLVFRTGGREYWGIQQTDWKSAPVLSGPNTRQKLRGRDFSLYYSGGKLHVVALREGGAVYWVVNTLLDSLSNETMLAIARGLKPLPEPKRKPRRPGN